MVHPIMTQVALAKALLLFLLYFLSLSLGTTLRRGRDGLSELHTSVARISLVLLHLTVALYLIVKVRESSEDNCSLAYCSY